MESGDGQGPARAGAGSREDRSPARAHQARPARKAVRPSPADLPSSSSVRRSHNAPLWSTSASGSPSTSREPSPSKRPVSIRPDGRKNSRGGTIANGQNGREGASSGTGTRTEVAMERTLGPATPPMSGPAIIGGEPSMSLKSPTGEKGGGGGGGGEGKGPQRLKTARLKSPPPSASSTQAARLATQSTPTLAMPMQRTTAGATSPRFAPSGHREAPPGDDLDGPPLPSGVRTPVRAVGTSIGSGLETVQESSLPSTPAIDLTRHIRSLGSSMQPDEKTDAPSHDEKMPEPKAVLGPGEAKASGDGPPKRVPAPNSSAQLTRPTTMPPSIAHSSAHPKVKTNAEGSVQSMTVETETVSSIPQVALSGGTGERGGASRSEAGGSVRLRPSVETLKPRRDKRRTIRKAPSLVPGTSKADIFEARVANAVGQANSSDSEETFVYESNPPEPPTARPGRHHSRTPSAASVQSQMEQRAAIFAHHPLHSKRSMKFSSNLMTSTPSDQEAGTGSDGVGFGRGSGRSSGPGSAPHHHHHHHHIGHWARAGRGSPVVWFDHEAPFGSAPKPSRTATANNSRHSSRATSPRNAHYLRLSTSTGKKIGHVAAYDIDVESMGDERTPLVGSIRVGRRRTTSVSEGVRRDRYPSTNRWLTCFAGCLALTTVVLLVVIGAMGFYLATTKPLREVARG